MIRSALPLGLLLLTSLACASAGGAEAQRRPYPDSRSYAPPRVSVWLSGSSVLHRGMRTPVHFRVDRDAYVTVARLDTDGRITILHPRSPYQQRMVRAGRTYTLSGTNTFRVDDHIGLGYVFAIASYEPFDYSSISRGQRWDYMYVRHARHDPYEAMYDLAETIVWDRRTRYSMDYAEYHVGRYVSYPRYMCIDAYLGDPYSCRRFAIIYRQSPYRYGYGPYYGYPDRAVLIREPSRYGRIEQRPTRPGDTRPVDAVERRRRDDDDRDRRSQPTDPRRRGVVESESGVGVGTPLPTPRRTPDAAAERDAGDDRQRPIVVSPPRRTVEQDPPARSDQPPAERGSDPRATPRRAPDTQPAPSPQARPAQRPAPRAESDRRRDPPPRESSERRDERSNGATNATERRRRSPEQE